MHRTSATVISPLKGKSGLSSASIWARFSNLAGVTRQGWRFGTTGLCCDGLDSLESNLGQFRVYVYARIKNLMTILVALYCFMQHNKVTYTPSELY